MLHWHFFLVRVRCRPRKAARLFTTPNSTYSKPSNIAGIKFNGPAEVVAFAERDIWGGKYKVEKAFKQGTKEIVHCLFWPQDWSSAEPPIEYQFQTENGKIINWYGKYR